MKTFALIAYILIGGESHEFVVDSGMIEDSCLVEAGELKWIELAEGFEIRVDAAEVEGLLCEEAP